MGRPLKNQIILIPRCFNSVIQSLMIKVFILNPKDYPWTLPECSSLLHKQAFQGFPTISSSTFHTSEIFFSPGQTNLGKSTAVVASLSAKFWEQVKALSIPDLSFKPRGRVVRPLLHFHNDKG